MNRRQFMTALALSAGAAGRAGAQATPDLGRHHPLIEAWEAWKAAYLAPDGRVIDGFQDGASHSEGQGYGMVLATCFDDADAFERMLVWTGENLAVRGDALLAWRWRPGPDGPAVERNNASDGDLLHAWALVRAAALFREPSLGDRARTVATALAEQCVAAHPDGSGRLLLLPAADGFVRDDAFVVNPSYLIPRALREVSAATDVPALARCAEDGVAMLASLAAYGLAPDWIAATPSGFAPAEGFSENNGYEAMRIGLYLAWSGLPAHPAASRQAEAYRAALDGGAAIGVRPAPTVMERRSLRVIERSPHAGYAALGGLLLCLDDAVIGAAIPPFTTEQPYYPATLHLLTLVAQAERYPTCVPI
jgi:endoglucanase